MERCPEPVACTSYTAEAINPQPAQRSRSFGGACMLHNIMLSSSPYQIHIVLVHLRHIFVQLVDFFFNAIISSREIYSRYRRVKGITVIRHRHPKERKFSGKNSSLLRARLIFRSRPFVNWTCEMDFFRRLLRRKIYGPVSSVHISRIHAAAIATGGAQHTKRMYFSNRELCAARAYEK